MVATEINQTSVFYEALPASMNVPQRDVLIDVDKQLRKSSRFVALRGSSGSGKSYFLRNQLIPYYRKRSMGKDVATEGEWRVVSFRPQINPIGTLAAALAHPGALRDQGKVQPFYREQIEQQLRVGNDGLIKVYRDAVDAKEKPFRLLIVVDQLETMFRMEDELLEERNAQYKGLGKHFKQGDDALFFNLFLKLLDTELPVYVIFSIGSDSIDRLNAFQGWPEKVSKYRYALPHISPAAMQAELLTHWKPGYDRPLPKGAQQLYQRIMQDYNNLSAEDKEPAARVNITLKLLNDKSNIIVDRPFAKLKAPPKFIQRALSEGETALKRGELVRERLIKPDNRRAWLKWLRDAPEDERKVWENAVENYFSLLAQEYFNIGGLEGAPNYFFTKRYEELSEQDQLLASRLFGAITLKDAAPLRLMEGYSVPFDTLCQVCYRDGSEYPQILGVLQDDFEAKEPPNAIERAVRKDKIRELVHHFNFRGGIIPDLIRWVDPASRPDQTEVFIDDVMVIRPGSSMLLQEWKLLSKWVNDEYAAANIYKKLVDDAKMHYRDAVENNEELPVSKAAVAFIPDRTYLGTLLATLTGAVSRAWHRQWRADSADQKRNRNLLSEGGLELTGEWFAETIPSEIWAAKYRPERVVIDREEKDGPFTEWINDGAWTSFPLALAYWEKSKDYHNRRQQNEAAKVKAQIEFQRKRSLLMTGLAVVSVICMFGAFYSLKQTTNERNNLRLLEFVDSMTKTGLIPSGIYRSDEFAELKQEIEKKASIETKRQVIDVLAKGGVLAMPDREKYPVYYAVEELALLQIDSLANGDYLRADGILNQIPPKGLKNMSLSILANANRARAHNDTISNVHYQYPYVFHALWENTGMLSSALLKEQQGGRKIRGLNEEKRNDRDLSVLHTAWARITAVESNPIVADQYAVADATGRITVFSGDNVPFERMQRIRKSISSLRYTPNGRVLYATTYGGEIYYYSPLRSEVFAGTPLGIDNMEWTELKVRWKRRGKDLPITSLHITSSPDHLVVVGDESITLIRRSGINRYTEVQYYDVNQSEKVTAMKTAANNQEGTHFMLGGSNASALFEFDEDRGRLNIVKVVEHPELSVSAIAFQPKQASRDRALNGLALGTETGEIWLTSLGTLLQSKEENIVLEREDRIMSQGVVSDNFQESAISGLVYNHIGEGKDGNDQLIASSYDGTVWLYNLDQLPERPYQFLTGQTSPVDFDHLRLANSGRSVNNLCLINPNKIAAVENNIVLGWPTNIHPLRNEGVKKRIYYLRDKEQ